MPKTQQLYIPISINLLFAFIFKNLPRWWQWKDLALWKQRKTRMKKRKDSWEMDTHNPLYHQLWSAHMFALCTEKWLNAVFQRPPLSSSSPLLCFEWIKWELRTGMFKSFDLSLVIFVILRQRKAAFPRLRTHIKRWIRVSRC